ncbi:hypothetical protein U1Q18_050461 [Sarracenia purpurea var. burkii]
MIYDLLTQFTVVFTLFSSFIKIVEYWCWLHIDVRSRRTDSNIWSYLVRRFYSQQPRAASVLGEYSYEYDIGKETIDQYRNFSPLIVKISNHWKHITYTKYNTLAPTTPSSSPPRSKTKRKFQLFVSPSK